MRLFFIMYLTGMIVIAAWVMFAWRTTRDHPACSHSARPTALSCREAGHAPEPLDLAALKTGDLLGISYSGARAVFSASAYRSVWTHVGLVWIHPVSREPFVIEAATYRRPYSGGILKIPLLHWARINRNVQYIAHIPLNKPADPNAIDAAFSDIETAGVGVQGLSLDWVKFATTRKKAELPPTCLYAPRSIRQAPQSRVSAGFNPKAVAMSKAVKPYVPSGVYNRWLDMGPGFNYVTTCNELTVHLLQEAGVVDKTLAPSSFIPSQIIRARLPMSPGWEYGVPAEVSVHYLIEDELPGDFVTDDEDAISRPPYVIKTERYERRKKRCGLAKKNIAPAVGVV